MGQPGHAFDASPPGGGATEQHSDVVRSCRWGPGWCGVADACMRALCSLWLASSPCMLLPAAAVGQCFDLAAHVSDASYKSLGPLCCAMARRFTVLPSLLSSSLMSCPVSRPSILNHMLYAGRR